MKKGQEWIGGLFSLLLTVIVAGVALPAILPGQELKVTPEVEAEEFENKVILLANSLMSNPNMVYHDGNSYQRGIFDKDKLDLIENDPSSLTPYPGTYTLVVIEDMDSTPKEFWIFSIKDAESENIKQFLECSKQEDISDPIKECAPKRFSEVFKGFPVAIRYSDDNVHKGRLELTVVE